MDYGGKEFIVDGKSYMVNCDGVETIAEIAKAFHRIATSYAAKTFRATTFCGQKVNQVNRRRDITGNLLSYGEDLSWTMPVCSLEDRMCRDCYHCYFHSPKNAEKMHKCMRGP